MYFSLPSSKCIKWPSLPQMSPILTALRGNFAFTPSPATSPCLCVLTVAVIVDSYRPDPQETEQAAVVTAHLPCGLMSLCLAGT